MKIQLLTIPYHVNAARDLNVILINGATYMYSAGSAQLAAKCKIDTLGMGVIVFDTQTVSFWSHCINNEMFEVKHAAHLEVIGSVIETYNKNNQNYPIIYKK